LTDLFLSYAHFAQFFVNLTSISTLKNTTSSPVDYLNSIHFMGSNPLNSEEKVILWYNPKGYDASVSYLNVLNNAFLRSKANAINKSPNDLGSIYFLLIF